MIFRLTPSNPFPDNLSDLRHADLQVLDSQLRRQLDHEYVHELDAHPETLFRMADLQEELGLRELQAAPGTPVFEAAL